ncbi:hypothetical protein SS209_00455 [Salmonella enterica subsp. enterica serovar Senftenberg str. SS209]
MDNS